MFQFLICDIFQIILFFSVPFLMALIVTVTLSSADISDGSTYFFVFNCFKNHVR